MGCDASKVEPFSVKPTIQPEPKITVLDSDKPPSRPNMIHITDFSEMCEVTLSIKRKPKD